MKVRFGGFQLDGDARQVFGPNGEVHLSPKAFELLRVLLESRPRAVSKAELQNTLWPDTFVSEANLPLLVSDLRSALGDPAKSPRFIRTVPRFGYAFSGVVRDADEQGQPAGEARCYLTIGTDRVPLREGSTTVGRDARADIIAPASGVSRLHARIHVTGAGVTIEDLGSKNGTFVRGVRLDGVARLSDGDEIRLGMLPITFRTAAPSPTTETLQSARLKTGSVTRSR